MRIYLLHTLCLGGVIIAAVGVNSLLPDSTSYHTGSRPTITASETAPDCPMGKALGMTSNPLRRGKAVYAAHCASCHGDLGAGDGTLAPLLHPRPRDFTSGIYKLRSTASGMPTDQDLYDVISNGMGGGSMPSFYFLSESLRRDLVEYVKHLSRRQEDGVMVEWFVENQPGSSIPVPQKPEFTGSLIEQGRTIYRKLDCAGCHGDEGRGDGAQASSLADVWGGKLQPRNLHSDAFIGGDTDEAIYLRIAAGIGGTPMLPYPDGRIAPEERWALVAYLRSLREASAYLGKGMPNLNARFESTRTEGPLPATCRDAAWEQAIPTLIPLNTVWNTRGSAASAQLRSLHDGTEIVILLEWNNPNPVLRESRVQDYPDKAALQFSLGQKPGFIGMGDWFHPVHIWTWRTVGAASADKPANFIATSYPHMKPGMYPEAGDHYHSAIMAGNPISVLEPHWFEEANAHGPATLQVQAPSAQQISGDAGWAEGVWRVIMRHPLNATDKGDIDLSPGQRVPVAVAIWDGRNAQRGGQKNVSTWYYLEVKP